MDEKTDKKEQFVPEEVIYLPEEKRLPERETLVENTAKEVLLEKEELHGMPFPPKCEPNIQPCPNYPTKSLFRFQMPKIDKEIRLAWVGSHQDIIVLNFIRTIEMAGYPLNYNSNDLYVSDIKGNLLWKKYATHSGGVHVIPTITKQGVLILSSQQIAPNPPLKSGLRTNVGGYDLKTGTLLWFFSIEDQTLQKPATREDVVYFADRELLALDANTGKVLWKRDLMGATPRNVPFESQQFGPVIGYDRLYALSREGVLFAFDFHGNKLWEKPMLEEDPPNTTSIQRTASLAVGSQGHIYFHNRKELWGMTSAGDIRWNFKSYILGRTLNITHLTIDKNENLYFNNGRIIASVDKDGKFRWDITINNVNHPEFWWMTSPQPTPPLHFDNKHLYDFSPYAQFALFDDKGFFLEKYQGYPPKDMDSSTPFFLVHLPLPRITIGPKNLLLAYLRDYNINEYIFFTIDMGIKKAEGYWPLSYGDIRSSSQVQSP